MRGRAKWLWRLGCAALILALLVLAGTTWTAYKNWADAQRDATIARSNRAYLQDLNELLGELKDAETGQSGYLLTGREDFLRPYKQALQPIQTSLQKLSKVAKDRADQLAVIERLESQTQGKMAELAITIDLRKTKGFDAALAHVLTDRGSAAMNEIRQECRTASDAVSMETAERAAQARDHQRVAIMIAGGGGVVLFLLMLGGFITVTKGANEQARLAEHLANSREMFETTLTSIGDGVIATDTNGIVTFINPEAASLSGWPKSEALGKRLDEIFNIVNETSRQRVENPFEKVMRTGSIAGLANHTTLLRKDGSEIPIDDSGAPIRNVEGKINGVVLIFRNISDRRKVEASLELSHTEVLKANDELRQFSYAATHDLQEPLRTIVVFSQLLGRNYPQLLDLQGQHLLQTVVDAANRMSALIEDLLAYTRAGGMDATANRMVVNSSEILRETIVQLHGAIQENNAVITHDELPHVMSDPAQLSQVFQNLLSNAIKYKKAEAPPIIHVSATNEGERATFRVVDNGMGFKQEYAERIFLLFQRLHGRAIPGTGIGLALCRRIVERHGGRIWARSEENVGTSFYFTMPLAKDQVTAV